LVFLSAGRIQAFNHVPTPKPSIIPC